MNAFASVKKALESLPGFRRGAMAAEDWEGESDPFAREIMRLTQTQLLETADEPEARAALLTQISHIAYIGGPSAAKAAVTIVPVIFNILTDTDVNTDYKLQVLRNFCELGQKNPGAQELLAQNAEVLDVLSDFISDVTRVRESRWAVYTLLVVSADNIVLMETIRDHPGMEDSLHTCAEFPIPWLAWGCNLADLLLKVLGLVNPRDPPPV